MLKFAFTVMVLNGLMVMGIGTSFGSLGSGTTVVSGQPPMHVGVGGGGVGGDVGVGVGVSGGVGDGHVSHGGGVGVGIGGLVILSVPQPKRE